MVSTPHCRNGKIATKRATFTLEQLHAELGGKLREAKREVERLTQAMQHVEAVLKLLQPGYRLQSIVVRRRKPNQFFKRGTLLRHVLDLLRKAERPLSPREIALQLLEAKGVTSAAPKDISRLTGSILSALQNHKGKGLVTNAQTSPVRWSVSDV
jgi:hypothetical protein